MAAQRELEVTRRSVFGKQTKKLRREGKIPGNIYGHGLESIAVEFDSHTFERLSHQSGFRSIVSLKGLGSSVETVLVRSVQLDPIKDKVLHVDFTRVSMDERIETEIPLHFVGEAPGVKLTGGVLLHLVEALPVACSASDIVGAIEVDISPLTEIDAMLYAREVKLPANYALTIDPEEPIVKVAAPRARAAEVEVVEAPAPATSAEAPATKTDLS
jgi:large subunit ribosomal protein L25